METGGEPGSGPDDWQALNRANWDDRVPIHLASTFYDLDGFRARRDSLRPFEPGEVGDVTGKRLVHLQCHIGLDTLSWAQRGARVSGLDFSAPAIEAAAALARELAIEASFVVSGVYEASSALAGQRFDIVYTGAGALVWLPDLARWAHVVASLLAPGGFLYLVEGHPFAQILDDDGSVLTVARDYFGGPEVSDYPWTYADSERPLEHTRSVQFQHGIGEVISVLTGAGLAVEFLHEYDFEDFQRFGSSRRRDDGSYRLDKGRPRVPLMYSLRASGPG